MNPRIAVLLDTSFLLPSFRVDVGKRVEAGLELLAERQSAVRVLYSKYSLLEAVFVLLGLVKRGRLSFDDACEMVRNGVSSVVYSLEPVMEPPAAYERALRMYQLGHRDLFDNILYSTAFELGAKFLTVDQRLIEFARVHRMGEVAVTPRELEVLLREKR